MTMTKKNLFRIKVRDCYEQYMKNERKALRRLFGSFVSGLSAGAIATYRQSRRKRSWQLSTTTSSLNFAISITKATCVTLNRGH